MLICWCLTIIFFFTGERLIQYASENLVTEILIHPQYNTLIQCMRNLLSSFTRHRHIIHAGYTFSGNGSWILQVPLTIIFLLIFQILLSSFVDGLFNFFIYFGWLCTDATFFHIPSLPTKAHAGEYYYYTKSGTQKNGILISCKGEERHFVFVNLYCCYVPSYVRT